MAPPKTLALLRRSPAQADAFLASILSGHGGETAVRESQFVAWTGWRRPLTCCPTRCGQPLFVRLALSSGGALRTQKDLDACQTLFPDFMECYPMSLALDVDGS